MIPKYINGLQKLMNITECDGCVIIINGCETVEYCYKGFEDLKDFVINYYIDEMFTWKPMNLTNIWILHWVSRQAMTKTVERCTFKLKCYLQSMWYNV